MQYLETTEIPIEDLLGYPGNARRHAMAVLAESAKTNGQYRSVVARRLAGGQLEILAGHGTTAAFKSLGAQTIRVEVIECDDREAQRIVISDNRSSDLSGYDEDALLMLLEGVENLEGTGWTQQDLDKLAQVDTEGLSGDAVDNLTPQVWGVIVTVPDEGTQADLMERLTAQGYTVRAMIQ